MPVEASLDSRGWSLRILGLAPCALGSRHSLEISTDVFGASRENASTRPTGGIKVGSSRDRAWRGCRIE
jgi:hypothetical protein